MDEGARNAGGGSFPAGTPLIGGCRLRIALSCALLFVLLFSIYTSHNRFPFFYHPDEPDKVDQVITGKWNFHHPLLMLGTARLAKRALGIPDSEEPVVIMGRDLSAAFAAAGVVAFALLGLAVRGGRGFLLGLMLGLQHQVVELAHYFKEDTALLFAIGLAFLALHGYWRRGHGVAAALAGAACGLCLSAKYLGAVMLAPALAILLAAPRRRAAHGLLFFAAFAAVALAINWPILLQLDLFRHSFGRETALVAHGERALSGQVPLFEYLRIFVANTNPVIWLLLLAELAAHWRARRERDVFDWVMLIFPFAFTLLLSCSTKTNDRYFLPATAGFSYLAMLGALDLPALFRLGPGPAKAAVAVALGAAIVTTCLYALPFRAAFQNDDRADLQRWIGANLPAGAVIAGEDHADLPVPRRRERLQVQPLLPQKVIETKYAADLGATPADLAAKGIGYIVISESDYGLLFRSAAAHLSPELQRKKAFYLTLFAGEQPLWERARGRTGVYLHPGLRLYRLRPAS